MAFLSALTSFYPYKLCAFERFHGIFYHILSQSLQNMKRYNVSKYEKLLYCLPDLVMSS